ncbi:MAG TPA: ComF family protein, partial [Catenuloplanes sp.]
MLTRAARWGAELGQSLAELVLPTVCAGCGDGDQPLRYGTCAHCAATLEGLVPRPVCPYPPPPGLPWCAAVGDYEGALRDLLLAYKERGRHRLARPLGVLLAGAVVEAVGAGGPAPVVLVPVPSTAHAVRQRGGDHLARLTRQAAYRLRSAGWSVAVARPLRARPR